MKVTLSKRLRLAESEVASLKAENVRLRVGLAPSASRASEGKGQNRLTTRATQSPTAAPATATTGKPAGPRRALTVSEKQKRAAGPPPDDGLKRAFGKVLDTKENRERARELRAEARIKPAEEMRGGVYG